MKRCSWIWRALTPAMLIWAGCLQASELRVEGGALVMEGTLVVQDLFILGNAWLYGNGTLAGNLTALGNVAPGGLAIQDVGTQRVAGAVTFLPGSRFHCYAQSHTSVDRLESAGTVQGLGACGVSATNAPGCFPVDEIIIRGDASSDFSAFAPLDNWTWRLNTAGSVDLLLTHLRGDTDGDNMPDWWEIAHFSNRTNALAGANADTDNADNLSEYMADTDPNNGVSYFRIVAVSNIPPVEVWFTSSSNRDYTLEYSDDLLGGLWSVVTGQEDKPGIGGIYSLSDTNAPPTNRFYRIGVEDLP